VSRDARGDMEEVRTRHEVIAPRSEAAATAYAHWQEVEAISSEQVSRVAARAKKKASKAR